MIAIAWTTLLALANDGTTTGIDRAPIPDVLNRMPRGARTEDLQLLAVDQSRRWVAYKRIVTIPEEPMEEPEPVGCNYAGAKNGDAGVELGVFDMTTGQTEKAWWVYEAVRKRKHCTPFKTSSKRLAEAKVRFAELGLDITSPPSRITLSALGLEERTPQVRVPAPVPEPNEHGVVQASDARKVSDTALWSDRREVYALHAMHHPMYGYSFEFPGGYRFEDDVVLVECHSHYGLRHNNRLCTFTPWLTVERQS